MFANFYNLKKSILLFAHGYICLYPWELKRFTDENEPDISVS